MGKTNSIKEKEKRNQAFKEFMDKLDKESDAEKTRLYEEVNEAIKHHYESNKWSYARLFGDRRSDYQNYSDWSLDRVNTIITRIGNALRGGDYPSDKVPESEKADPSTVKKAKEFMGLFAGDYTLILARVQALLSGVIAQFSVKSDVIRKSELRDIPLSGGLHLFFASSGKLYKEENYFTNEFIGSFQIVFEAYMSADEGRVIGLKQILTTTEHELAILDKLIIEIRQEQAESLKKIIKDSIKDYTSTKAAYDQALNETKKDREKVFEQYTKYKGVTDTVDRLFDQINLTTFGHPTEGEDLLMVEHLFNPWEAELASRYIKERLTT
ncbi:hypothetical protein [Photorhabdus sp. SF281]|uniref:hypothetical protein n=1 Tax=Photorhabdus sp. SF281 TaxID=3459527 RepID=UPI004043C498